MCPHIIKLDVGECVLGQKKIVVFRYPDRPYLFAPTLKFVQTFRSNFTIIYFKKMKFWCKIWYFSIKKISK